MRRLLLPAAAVLALAGCTTAPGPDATPTPTASAGDASCLIGSWRAGSAEIGSFFEDVAGDRLPQGASLQTDGSMSITFDDDGEVTYRPDLTFALPGWRDGSDASGSITGEASGTWRAEGGTVSVDADENDIDLTVTLGGTTIAGTDDYGWTALPIVSSDYTCSGDTLSLTAKLGAASHPIRFTRAD